jgi:hypothetical protein
VLRQVSINAIISCGATYVIITAGIDLSVGSLVAMSSCFAMLAIGRTDSDLVGVLVGIDRVKNDSSARRHEVVKHSKNEYSVFCRPDETEVAAHHQRGIEGTEGRVDSGEGTEAHVLHSSLLADLDGTRRDVDGDDVEPALLCFEAVPSGATTDVEDASLHGLEDTLLLGGPLAVLREEHIRGKRWAGTAVVEL